MLDLILFAIPALFVLAGALIVIFAKNPVHNSMGLVLTLASLAVVYITLNATFVAMVQMLVYAGAVMTLFLFVIMMIGVDKAEQTKEERDAKTAKTYLGNVKVVWTNGDNVAVAPRDDQQQQAPAPSAAVADDLPF